MTVLKNHKAIVDKMANLLRGFDYDLCDYQQDVYLYYDADTQTAELDVFVNVGGDSYLNDDHCTIHVDKEHFDNVFDRVLEDSDDKIQTLADILDITRQDLVQQTAKHFGYDVDDVDDWSVIDYVKSNDDYYTAIWDAYDDMLDDRMCDYYDQAADIIDRWMTGEIERY